MQAPGPQVQEVGPHTCAVTGPGHPRVIIANAGFAVTPSAVAFVDAGISASDGTLLWQAAQRLAPEGRKS